MGVNTNFGEFLNWKSVSIASMMSLPFTYLMDIIDSKLHMITCVNLAKVQDRRISGSKDWFTPLNIFDRILNLGNWFTKIIETLYGTSCSTKGFPYLKFHIMIQITLTLS